MQSQVFTVLSKVFSRLLSTELLEIFSREARSRNPSVAYSPLTPSLQPETRKLILVTLTLAHQPDSFAVSQSQSLPSHPHLLCLVLFAASTKEQTVSWARAALTHMNPNTCQSYFQMKHRASHSCCHRCFWKAVVLSRANTRSNQKDIL